jgi:3-oxoacyl-[acyl-carrier-protein] synthase-3
VRTDLNPRVRVSGTGSCLPERVVDNKTLASMVHGYDEARSGPFHHWVDQVTHIHERRFAPRETRSSDLALVASRRALQRAGVEAKDLGLIVYASFTLSQSIPGDHCVLAEHLGATGTPVFNLMAACAGSVYGLAMAYGMVASGVYEHVLVVGTETISKVLNFHDPVTSIIFGDGAGAAVVSRNDPGNGKGMLPPHLGFQYSARNITLANSNIPVDVGFYPDRELQPGIPLVEQALVEMESGPSVLRHAVNQMSLSAATALGYGAQDLKDPSNGLHATLKDAWIVPHQANGRIIDGIAEKLDLPSERVVRTIYRYGNISAASNLVALDEGIRNGNTSRRLADDGTVLEIVSQPEHRIAEGDLVLLPSIGGGYLMGCIGFVL